MTVPSPPPLYLLDTDILIEIERGNPAALAWFKGLTKIPTIPGLVVMEVYQGARNSREMGTLKKLLKPFPVAWPTTTDGEEAVWFFTSYRLSHNIGLIDSLIAATTSDWERHSAPETRSTTR